MTPALLALPGDLAGWRGTAAELADKCNEAMAEVPSLADDSGAANERLIRHYTQVGVLSPPEREGREALFESRQLVEFLAARYLIKDGWPLAKTAEIVRSSDVAGLTQLIPSLRTRLRAEEVNSTNRGGAAGDPETPLARAADITRRRASLGENLKALGNPAGRPVHGHVVRIELTPWCHADVDAAQLGAMSEDTPEILGAALAQALQEERIRK
jgi:DNA-binding transcriptional MerR regulator